MRVKQFIENTATRVLARLTDDVERQVSALLSEKRRPYTQDKSLFQEVDRRRQERLKAEFESLLPRPGSSTVPSNNMMRLFTKLTASSEECEAVEMEIALQAYCEIACRRYVDAIPMRLNEFVLTKFLQEMEEELLGTADAKLTKLMQDSTSKVAERKQLANELECLKNAKEEIDLVVGQ
uniref:GED domain-containing protein n=1 Tax=Globisporangium ultimum (strain ATCC 200006 / CBS 805.95 / DAOM BR144) TaxID=431595 RepID=K3WN36_GLOUD